MKFMDFVEKFRDSPVIYSQSFGVLETNNRLLRVQVHKWVKKGWLLELKRGVYILNKPFGKIPSLFYIANHLLFPSYISMESALSYYGIIPEGTFSVITSITTKKTSKYKNSLGLFMYHHIKRDLFFEFDKITVDGHNVHFAKPEKALLDYLYLKYVSEKDVEGLRLQNLELLNKEKFLSLSNEYSKRIYKIARRLL